MAKSQAIRPQPQPITAHYRAIGPAAIVAALLHTKKRAALKPKAA
jgi:hypothetical protein